MDKEKRIELLSPAGNYDALKQAVMGGADAVYLGGSDFGARAYAGNFAIDELGKAINYAHLYGVKVYVTVNTLISQENTYKFLEYIEKIVSLGADALIMQDLGMIDEVRARYDVPIHASTQMNNTGKDNALLLKSIGVERIVLARESGIDIIRDTSKIIDTEVFIHGALCISYSGQCLFSSMTLNRSGNEGKCAQNCRMKYRLLKDNIPAGDYKYLLSPKDICMGGDIVQLIDANAASLKIEGRMKSPQYVGYVTRMYRRLLDDYYDGNKPELSSIDFDTLSRLFNRGYTKGYLNGVSKDLMSIDRPNHQGVPVGEVIGVNKNKIRIKLSDTLNQGDGIKFQNSDTGFVCNKIYKNSKLVNSGKAGDIIELDNKAKTSTGDILLLTKDSALLKSLDNYSEKRISIDLSAVIRIGKPIEISISDKDGNTATIYHGETEKSRNKPLKKEQIIESLSKLGNTPYIANDVVIQIDDNTFIPKSVLNQARRNAVEALNALRTKIISRRKQTNKNSYTVNDTKPLSYSCKIESIRQYNIVKDYPFDRIYIIDFNDYTSLKDDKRIYYAVDSVNAKKDFTDERLLIGNTASLLQTKDNTVNGDYYLNARNSYTLKSLYKYGIHWVTLSPEVSMQGVKKITDTFCKNYGKYPNVEYIIYGRIQLMIIKHCTIGHDACVKCKKNDYALEDIKGNIYPIVCDENCCNHIYSKSYDKINSIDALKGANINSFRLDFIRCFDNEIITACNRVFPD